MSLIFRVDTIQLIQSIAPLQYTPRITTSSPSFTCVPSTHNTEQDNKMVLKRGLAVSNTYMAKEGQHDDSNWIEFPSGHRILVLSGNIEGAKRWVLCVTVTSVINSTYQFQLAIPKCGIRNICNEWPIGCRCVRTSHPMRFLVIVIWY